METLYFLLDKCLYDVQYIVSEFFTLAYHVHIIDSILILVEFVIDIFNIPRFQLVAVIVDFILQVIGRVDVIAVEFRLMHKNIHAVESLRDKFKHLVEMLVLLWREN